MKIDLEVLLKSLGLNVAWIAVFAAVLNLFGVGLNTVLGIAVTMIGLQLLISLAINVLKWAGVVTDGTAGKWSAVLNLCGLGLIAYLLASNPAFNFAKLDAQFVDIARFLNLLFGFVVQVAGTKYWHQSMSYGLGVTAFKARAA